MVRWACPRAAEARDALEEWADTLREVVEYGLVHAAKLDRPILHEGRQRTAMNHRGDMIGRRLQRDAFIEAVHFRHHAFVVADRHELRWVRGRRLARSEQLAHLARNRWRGRALRQPKHL